MGSSRLLVVDDEPAIRQFLTQVLENEGYAVQVASSGREALRCLVESGPFDLLLTDIRMDNGDGVELLTAAKTLSPDLVVILFTGYATVQSAVAAVRHGASDYLLKPVRNEDLIATVRSSLETRARQRRREQAEQVLGQMQGLIQQFDQRSQPGTQAMPMTLTCGVLALDKGAFRATLNGHILELTPTEFRLLVELAHAPGVTLDYGRLVQAACGYTCTRTEAREIIGGHIANLRHKMKIESGQPLYIDSIRGVGYRLIPPLQY
jgi:DNA-binding response OmpR family regulator